MEETPSPTVGTSQRRIWLDRLAMLVFGGVIGLLIVLALASAAPDRLFCAGVTVLGYTGSDGKEAGGCVRTNPDGSTWIEIMP